jgi:hypothetical protein
MENVDCDLIERAPKKIGPEGTWDDSEMGEWYPRIPPATIRQEGGPQVAVARRRSDDSAAFWQRTGG